jgi:cellulose synthase/poly-beta-1,6-N-acetylglucosamine synthase-like glycosyltransferase
MLSIAGFSCVNNINHSSASTNEDVFSKTSSNLEQMKVTVGQTTNSSLQKHNISCSILIPAHNEEKVIAEKIESIFDGSYPHDKIEVLVGSDASTDKTNEIVMNLSKKYTELKLINFSTRSGKIKIINHLKSIAKYEILILTDANVLFDKNTICELLKHFSNPKIALVDSNMHNIVEQRSGISKAESTYIRGEVRIKNDEGKVFGMMMGPFGGCYAVRKSFCEKIPENILVMDDFYINMKVLEKGGKSISEINAMVYEKIPDNWRVEFKRKIRIAAGSFSNLRIFSHLLLKFNTLSFCFFSHKVLRWLGPFFIISLYSTNLFILLDPIPNFSPSPFLLIFLLQNFILLLFVFDMLFKLININFLITRLVTHFLSTNLALLIGFFKFLGGVKESTWQPTER